MVSDYKIKMSEYNKLMITPTQVPLKLIWLLLKLIIQISQLVTPHEVIPNIVCIVGKVVSQTEDAAKTAYMVNKQHLSISTLSVYNMLSDWRSQWQHQSSHLETSWEGIHYYGYWAFGEMLWNSQVI